MPIGIPLVSRSALLVVVQNFCRRTGLTVPTAVIGSSDPQVAQLVALLEEEGNDLASRGSWQGLTYEATFTTVASESQGEMTTLAVNGFRYIKNDTLWDRTSRLPIWGPLSDQDWQARKAMAPTGPRYQARIRGGQLLVNPAPVAGHTWAFEYVSHNWIVSVTGSSFQQYFALDTDTILLPESIVLMGLRWRWKKEKGFAYEEDFRTYELQVKDALGRDGSKPVLCMDNDDWRAWPGVFVSPGSWPL